MEMFQELAANKMIYGVFFDKMWNDILQDDKPDENKLRFIYMMGKDFSSLNGPEHYHVYKNGNAKLVNLLIDNGLNIHSGPPGSLFNYLAGRYNQDVLLLLLKRGYTPTFKNMTSSYYTSPMKQAREEYLSKLKTLLISDRELYTAMIPRDIVNETMKFL
jgi:hypothetical protein